jgi:hypothetical protein
MRHPHLPQSQPQAKADAPDARIDAPVADARTDAPVSDPNAKAQAEVAAMQGLPVQGYRSQTPATVGAVNTNKAIEEQSLRVLDVLKDNPDVDQRWLAIGRTAIESGWMAVNRSVFKPDRAKLPGE